LSLIINTIPTHIYVLNTEGCVRYVNQAVIEYTGLSLDDVKQEDYRDRVIHPEDLRRVRAGRAASLRRGAPFSTEQRVLGNDRQYRWFLVRYNPQLDEQRRIDRWYVAAFDIDDRKRAEAQVEQAYLRLAEAQRLSKTGSFITDLLRTTTTGPRRPSAFSSSIPATKVTVQRIRIWSTPTICLIRLCDRARNDGYRRRLSLPDCYPSMRGEALTRMARVIEQIGGRPLFIGALQDVTEASLPRRPWTGPAPSSPMSLGSRR